MTSQINMIYLLRGIALSLFILSASFPLSHVEAKPLSFSVKDISAPHPKHCIDDRQWRDPHRYTPFNIFTDDQAVWVPCRIATQAPGYTVYFEFDEAIELDGFTLSQSLDVTRSIEKQTSKRKKRGRPTTQTKDQTPITRERFKRLQVLFYNQNISERYPFYFQEVRFDGKQTIRVEYEEVMRWNHNLISDPLFDETRRALKLPPEGITPPVKVDRIALVFWEYEGEGARPALSSISLLKGGTPIQLTGEAESRKRYGDIMGKVYDVMLRDHLFVSEERALLFSVTGTIWGMEGDEDVAKVMGAWRFVKGHIEVDLSAKQRTRVTPKGRRRLAKSRKTDYLPLHLIVDDAPDNIVIIDGPLAGTYESSLAPVPTQPLGTSDVEQPPPFEEPQ